MPKPNTFIIGAPKCGTTSVARWLAEHPEVFMSDPKEPYFFCRPSLQIGGIDTLEDYEALFAGAEDRTIIAEATTATLYDETALPRIYDYAPSCRIIVLLRNPIDMVVSWYGESVKHLREGFVSFADAWHAIEDRRSGLRIPVECPDPLMLDYRYMGSLGTQLDRVYQLVPKRQIHVAFLDDFINTPRKAWLKLLSFLSIPDDGRRVFPAYNTGHLPQNVRYYRSVRKIATLLKRRFGVKGSTGVVTRLTMAWDRPPSKHMLSAELRDELYDVFEGEIIKLEHLTGRDLSMWRS